MATVSDTEELLDLVENLLKAQLKAVNEMRRKRGTAREASAMEAGTAVKSMSQVEMAYKVLSEARQPLHIKEIVSQIQERFGANVTRDSLVSAIIKKVGQGQQFTKTGKNTFGLLNRNCP